MATYNKFDDFVDQLARGIHDWDAHSFKVALTNTAPSAANTILSDITQIANGNGYTTGGAATTITVSETFDVKFNNTDPCTLYVALTHDAGPMPG